jgi:hypothetical protein
LFLLPQETETGREKEVVVVDLEREERETGTKRLEDHHHHPDHSENLHLLIRRVDGRDGEGRLSLLGLMIGTQEKNVNVQVEVGLVIVGLEDVALLAVEVVVVVVVVVEIGVCQEEKSHLIGVVLLEKSKKKKAVKNQQMQGQWRDLN